MKDKVLALIPTVLLIRHTRVQYMRGLKLVQLFVSFGDITDINPKKRALLKFLRPRKEYLKRIVKTLIR